jgi:sugar transferase (PEP-CTERM/EpsH1 system associated)
MGNLLYLVHRLPYPPNKGDKVRSYHLLKHLTASHRVFLGTFVDDPDDERHVDTLRAMCPDLHVARLHPRWAKLSSLRALLSNKALGLQYYQNTGLQEWVNNVLSENAIDTAVIFSSVMAQYVENSQAPSTPMLVDFVDVDSHKWTQYAPNHAWPMSWLFRREGQRLLAYERAIAAKAQHSFFVTANEVALFASMAPESISKVKAIGNGVDADFFSPSVDRNSPFPEAVKPSGEVALVFTGAMDYWPNIDAVTWFATDILPKLVLVHPKIRFYIVGRSPTEAVLALATHKVVVTGTVPDVRPYLQHAALVVAPLRVARGLQNKILEAMAMARPVIASKSCVDALEVQRGTEIFAAESAENFITQISALLQTPEHLTSVGAAGRQCVVKHYSWDAHLSAIDPYLTQSATT